MSQPRYRPLLIIGLLAVFATPGSRHLAAAPPSEELKEVLSWVPSDSALFLHVDVAAIWKSQQIEAVRKANPQKIYDKLKELSDAVGVAPDDIQTLTLFMPKLKGPGDQQAICASVTLSKPYSGKQVVAALNALAEIKKIPDEFGFKKFKKVSDGIYAIEEPVRGRPKGENVEALKTLFLFNNPRRMTILGPMGNELAKPSDVKSGPISEAVAAASDGVTIALGVNFASLPDEIRQDNVPPQVEPFKPILHADAVIGTAKLTDTLQVQVAIKTETRPKALEAEKSIGVFKILIETLLSAGIQEIKGKEGNEKLVGLANQTIAMVKGMKISSNEKQAMAALTMPKDFDISPIFSLFDQTSSAVARASTSNNMKQLGLAMHNYHDTFTTFPPAATLGRKGKPLLSWRVAILPYIEQEVLYRKFKLDEPWDSEHNKKVFDENPMPKVFEVVGTTKPGSKDTHFQVFRGNGGMFDLVQGFKIQSITDGTSNTMMIVSAKTAVPWTKPDDIEYDPKNAKPHDWFLWVNDTTLVGFADGSVRNFAKTIKAASLHAMITRNGGEVVND